MTWYNSLAKPSWTPSRATIGLIWTILYPVIVVNFGFVHWLGELGFDQRMRATKVAPSAARALESFMNMPSQTVTQDSFSLMQAQPKLRA